MVHRLDLGSDPSHATRLWTAVHWCLSFQMIRKPMIGRTAPSHWIDSCPDELLLKVDTSRA